MAQVFHANTSEVRASGRSAFDGEAEWPWEYTLVARVETDDVETAYELTNHIGCPWWENAGVERVGPETRSTSTGDVVVIGNTAYKCESCGWSESHVSDAQLLRLNRIC